jgi:hypothetical protein
MMMLVMQMRRRLRRRGCSECYRKQQRSQKGSHATSPSNSQLRYALTGSSFPCVDTRLPARGDDGLQAPSRGSLWVRAA